MKAQGQSTVEYILLVTAVVGFVLFLTLGESSLFQSKMTNAVNSTAEGMKTMAAKITSGIARN